MTSVETKALCSILRQAEDQGYRILVEKMIGICDAKSGLKFEELWDWWEKHKQEDKVKQEALDKLLDSMRQQSPTTSWPKISRYPLQDPYVFNPNIQNPWVNPYKNSYEIIC